MMKPCTGCGNYAAFCTCLFPPPPIKVYAPCIQEWVPELGEEITNVCEGVQGEDIVTFTCSHCAKVHDSRRTG